MASYTAPPNSNNSNGAKINPLAPVAYKPSSSYVPSAPKTDRTKSIRQPGPNSTTLSNHHATNNNSLSATDDHGLVTSQSSNGSTLYPLPPIQHQHPSPLQQQEYQPQSTFQPSPLQNQYQPQAYTPNSGRRSADQHSSTGSSGSSLSSRDSVSYRTPAQHHQQQLHHQPSISSSSGYNKLPQVNEEENESRKSFQPVYRNDQNMSNNDLQNDVSSLNISSPPRQRQHPDHPVLSHLQQHQSPAGYTQNGGQHYQPYQSHEHLPQLQQPQYPFADSHGYSQQSPSASTASQLYRTSTGSSTIHTAWSQPSSPGFPPSPYTAHRSALHEQGEGDGQDSPLSESARLLIDFNAGILSTIAVAFRQKMLQNESKRLESANYGLEFPVTFTGKEAVDVIVELTKLDDRRHALAIARSMEQQLLFFGGGINQVLFDSNNDQYFFSEATLTFIPGRTEFPSAPVGVFPYTTPCYSYNCQPGGSPCYSYLCPNRQNISQVLGRHNSDLSAFGSQEKVWANSVPPSVVASASKKERNRQEAIFEVIQTEHNYVRDLELLEEIFITPLRASDIVDPDRLEELIEDVFMNFKELLALNKRLLAELRVRQEEQPLVESIGDILLAHVAGFEQSYTSYISRIVISEFMYKREEARNPKFAQFLKDCTRHPEARRLGLRHFIGQPYQRIPRYPLLLNEIIKRTDDGVSDRETVLEVIRVCTELGKRVDACIAEGNRHVRMLTVQDKIYFKSGEVPQDLKLSEKSRKLHFECLVRRRSNFDVQVIELRIFLFDHILLMTKEKRDKMSDKDGHVYQVSKNVGIPIPLELMHIWADDGKPMSMLNGREPTPGRKLNNSTKSTGSGHRQSIVGGHQHETAYRLGFQETKFSAPVTIEHHGRRVYTLYMTPADRDQFMEKIEIAQTLRKEAVSGSHLFKTSVITHMNAAPPIPSANLVHNPLDGRKVTCSATYLNVLDGKRRVVIGTEDGVFVGMEDDPYSFRLALAELHVGQVSVLEAYHILLVLTGKVLKAFNLSCLDPNTEKSLQIGQQLGKSVQFFSAGTCVGKTLVITMKKKNAGESHFSAYEPVENAVLGHHPRGFSLSFGKSNKSEWFKLYKRFYVGTDSSQLLMLAKMVCVVCQKGFEVLMLENLNNTQVFPLRTDPNFAFLDQRPNSVPVSMFRVNSDDFLMCYTDFAFLMTKKGELAKKELIEWEGRPESFALAYPYIIAIEAGLIEIRHIETGALEQLILGNNIRRLYSTVDHNGNAVIQLLMSDPNNAEVRQIVKLRQCHPGAKSDNGYLNPKDSLNSRNGKVTPVACDQRPKSQIYQQSSAVSTSSSHLMSSALQPVLSTNGSGPAVLASHAHPSQYDQHQPSQYHQQWQQQQPVFQGLSSAPPPPIPQRPSPRLTHQQIYPAYPVHPYAPSKQAYPQVQIPLEGDENGNHQQYQQQQQFQGQHATSWSSGGYP
ncbi:RHO1 GDP-GTP exchange protein 2 [Gryganskiella cystojenkinii]|nr:RHO1 GDP-GTP exchange protein 2 [Gryganskiella cystojenkinii]